jgi:hypothetical protein
VQDGITEIDRALPGLQHLTLIYTRSDARPFTFGTPLSGLAALRTFTFEHMGGHATPRIALSMGRLGSQDLVYHNQRLKTAKQKQGFNVLARKARMGGSDCP